MPRGICLWCKHGKQAHTGRVDPEVRARIPHPRSGPWTPTACAVKACECRRYEK